MVKYYAVGEKVRKPLELRKCVNKRWHMHAV